jgi:hypothetical protein
MVGSLLEALALGVPYCNPGRTATEADDAGVRTSGVVAGLHGMPVV